MDPLTALRSAIMASHEDRIRVEGGTMHIDGMTFPALAETAFKIQKGSRHYKLLALWLQYLTKDKAFSDYMKLSSEYKLSVSDLVLVIEKKVVVEYLKGESVALGHIDTSALSTAGRDDSVGGVSLCSHMWRCTRLEWGMRGFQPPAQCTTLGGKPRCLLSADSSLHPAAGRFRGRCQRHRR